MSVPANELESTFCSILGESQSKNTGEGHWLCHPVGNQGCTIAKFLRSKDCQHVLNVRKDIEKVTAPDLGLPGSIKLYLNEIQCLYYSVLWSNIL